MSCVVPWIINEVCNCHIQIFLARELEMLYYLKPGFYDELELWLWLALFVTQLLKLYKYSQSSINNDEEQKTSKGSKQI